MGQKQHHEGILLKLAKGSDSITVRFIKLDKFRFPTAQRWVIIEGQSLKQLGTSQSQGFLGVWLA